MCKQCPYLLIRDKGIDPCRNISGGDQLLIVRGAGLSPTSSHFTPVPPFPPFYELIKFLAIDSKQFKHSVFISKPSARLYSQTMNQLALRKFRLGNIRVSDQNIVANSHTFKKKTLYEQCCVEILEAK